MSHLHYQHIEPGDDIWCPDCKDITRAGQIDLGHGVTEFWGSVSCHHDWVTCCATCGCEDVELPREEEAYDEEAEAG